MMTRAEEAIGGPLGSTIEVTCQNTGLGRTFVYELIRQGKLDARKIGNRTIVTYASQKRLIEEAPRLHPKGNGSEAA